MNVSEEMVATLGYDRHFVVTKGALEKHFGNCDLLLCTDTLQYSDYDRYESEMFDEASKIRRHSVVFPEDCRRAIELGARLASS